MKKSTVFWVMACVAAVSASETPVRLTGADGGLVLFEQGHTSYVESEEGLEVHANVKNVRDPLYLSLDVKASELIDGAAPVQEFSFEYFDSGLEQVTFDIDSLDPLYGGKNDAGIWRGAGGFQLMGTDTWKTKTITLHDARFSNRLNGADIRFRILNCPHFRIRNVSLTKLDAMPPPPETTLKQGEVPNILMVVFDDLNDYVGTFGDPNAKTPNLDSFAEGAMRFEKAYCQYPVCGPSRASFMTGLYPEASGILDNNSHFRVERPDALNMLEYFKGQGYWTASAGKIYHSSQNVAENGVSTYFSDWFRNAKDPWREKLEKQFIAEVGPIDANRPAFDAFMKEKFISPERIVQAIATDMPDEDHKDGRIATKISTYLEEKPFGDKPFFLAAGFAKPHVPFFAPKKYFDMYPVDELEFEDVPADDWANRPKVALYDKFKGYGVEFEVTDREKRAKWLQAYLACISLADAQVGRVLKALEDTGYADNTIIVMFGDHGYHIGEHFLYGKVTLFEESARVPFMMRVPGMTEPGSTTKSFTELIDVYPTLVDLCGLDAPAHLEGESLVPVLKNSNKSVRDSAYTVVTRGDMVAQSVRYKNWRYAEWGGPDQAELYDLEKDPNEYHNLANNPEYSRVLKKVRKKMEKRNPDYESGWFF